MNKKVRSRRMLSHPTFFFIFILFFSLSCKKNIEDVDELIRPTKDAIIEIPDVHPDDSNVIKILSLKKFIEACKENPQNPEVLEMFGMQRIEGYIIDNINSDILLFAKQVKNWPSTSIFDYIESLRNISDSTSLPYCSLEPSVKGISAFEKYWNSVDPEKFDMEYAKQQFGKQSCVIGGVAAKSNFAWIMIDADYQMKKVSQGVVRLDSVKSVWDYEKMNNYSGDVGMSRFWFNIEDKYPYFEGSDNMIRISELPILVSTLTTKVENGVIIDTPGNNPVFNQFAEGFTKQFKSSSRQVECYAKLDNLYHLQAINDALRVNGGFSNFSTLFQYFKKTYPITQTISFPDELESVISFTKVTKNGGTNILYLILYGGVDLNSTFSPSKIQRSNSDFLNVKTIDFLKQINHDEKKPVIIFDLKKNKYQVNNLLPFIFRGLKFEFLKNSVVVIDYENVA